MPDLFIHKEPEDNKIQLFPNGVSINLENIKFPTANELPNPNSSAIGGGRKRGRKPKQEATTMPILAQEKPPAETVENINYRKTYEETTNMLKGTIDQIDKLTYEMEQDIGTIRNSKTLKNKFGYLKDYLGAAGSLLGNKISAIREIGNNITNANRLEIQRIKDLKLNTQNEEDSDKRIIDMYNAFVNTPIGVGGMGVGMLAPPPSEAIVGGVQGIDLHTSNDPGYDNFKQRITPELNRAIMDSNPNIETVVVYNQETGQRWFDVIDNNTGQSIPSDQYPRPSEILLEDMQINVRAGIARNANIDSNYRLIITGIPDDNMSDF